MERDGERAERAKRVKKRIINERRGSGEEEREKRGERGEATSARAR